MCKNRKETSPLQSNSRSKKKMKIPSVQIHLLASVFDQLGATSASPINGRPDLHHTAWEDCRTHDARGRVGRRSTAPPPPTAEREGDRVFACEEESPARREEETAMVWFGIRARVRMNYQSRIHIKHEEPPMHTALFEIDRSIDPRVVRATPADGYIRHVRRCAGSEAAEVAA